MADPTAAEQLQARVAHLARIAHERDWPDEEVPEESEQMELEAGGRER